MNILFTIKAVPFNVRLDFPVAIVYACLSGNVKDTLNVFWKCSNTAAMLGIQLLHPSTNDGKMLYGNLRIILGFNDI